MSDGDEATKLSSTASSYTTNVIVMSDAGKPIFARHGSEEEVSRQCGLVQALRTAVNGNSALGLGEIQSLHSNELSMVFMTVGSITLLSISTKSNMGVIETEAFFRLQLEYVFAQLIFTLTEQVQTVFLHNPAFDLRSVMSSSDNLLRGILDESGPDRNSGLFLVAGVQSVYPISNRIRHKASIVLQSIAGKPENNTAFALLVTGDKLLTVVQPAFRPHQLRVSDLHLILNFIGKQPGLASSELWIPMCLPRFNSSGFLYAYTNCLDVQSKLTLILLSSHNTPEQFQILRSSSQQIREDLALPQVADSVLTIVADDRRQSALSDTVTSGSDVGWRRNDESASFDEDYVNISIHGSDVVENGELLCQVRQALELSTMDHICKQYLDDEESLIHFLFRVDIPVKNSRHRHNGRHGRPPHPNCGSGHLSQCISPSIEGEPYCSSTFRRNLWSNYQKLSLRLRLGSATVESAMDAFDMINESCRDEEAKTHEHGSFPGIGKNCPSMGLFESPPFNSDGLSYIVQGDETYFAMNGKNFELYVAHQKTLSSTSCIAFLTDSCCDFWCYTDDRYMATANNVPVKRAAAIGTKLVRGLTSDEKSLFLTRPLTWRD